MSRVFLAVLATLAVSVPGFSQESKNPPQGTHSVAAPSGAGGFGPDAFGYLGFDSSQPECTFDFVDISATGTLIGDGDDVGFPVTLPGAPFDFYGSAVSELAFSSNGYLATDITDTGPDLSNDCPLPVTPSTGGGARIYPLHDDIDAEPGIGRLVFQYFASCPRPSGWGGDEGCYVFQWDDVSHFPGGGGAATFDFQAILYETSFGIVFQHGPGNPELGSGSTTGIQNDGATVGLTYACDAANSVLDNSAQCIYHPDFPFGSGAGVPLPEAQAVPGSSSYGLIALGVLLGLVGLLAVRRLS